MKNKKNLLLACILLFLITKVNGQQPEIITPSINAQQFFNVRTSVEDLHTGQTTFRLPLFNIESKGIRLPINLVFTGLSFVNPEDRIASNVGFGWSLIAGGVINHTVRGKKDSKQNDSKWKSNDRFLSDIKSDQDNNRYTSSNKFEQQIQSAIGFDAEPDEFSYSFNGYSGKILFKTDTSNNYTGQLFPDLTFKIEYINSDESTKIDGYKIITNEGVEYFFTCKGSTENGGFSGSYFLTKILSPQGGEISIEYADDYYDKRSVSLSRTVQYNAKRIKKIIFDNGYILFNAESRNDIVFSGSESKKAKRISSIELYNKSNKFIKGFELINFKNDTNTLDKVIQYDKHKNYLTPYEFKYIDDFNSNGGCTTAKSVCSKYSWASWPIPISVTDRRFGGLEPIIYESDENPDPQYTIFDGGNRKGSFRLSKVIFPTGGYESYKYEDHDYSAFGSNKNVSHPIGVPRIEGKRIVEKKVVDDFGNSKTVEYWYCFHDSNYNRVLKSFNERTDLRLRVKSSGVLVNPAIKIATSYKPIYNDISNTRIPIHGHWNVRDRFVASAQPHEWIRYPHNRLGSSFPVYYKEVEEVFVTDTGIDNGSNIYYFQDEIAVPAQNYMYLNYNNNKRGNDLINLRNNLYGDLEDGNAGFGSYSKKTFLAYPVGDFFHYDYLTGKILKKITLNSNKQLLKKVENNYSSGWSRKRYGLIVRKFEDGKHNDEWPKNRYLISLYTKIYGYVLLDKKIITDYYPSSGEKLIQEIDYQYTNMNLLRSKTITNSDGKTKKNIYYHLKDYSTTTNNINYLKNKNILGKTVDVRSYKNDTLLVSGIQTKYNLKGQPESTHITKTNGVNIPVDLENPYTFTHDVASYTYQNDVVTEISPRDDKKIVYLWDSTNKYVMAKIENAVYADVSSLNGKESSSYNSKELYDKIKAKVNESAMITTYTYKDLVGMAQKTDARGYTTYYIYDSFNRLKQVKDENGNVLSQNEYHYKGQ